MDFAAEAIKHIQAALDAGANIVYVCPEKHRDVEQIKATIMADKVWRDTFTFAQKPGNQDVFAVLDASLLIAHADTLPKPVYDYQRVPGDIAGTEKLVRDEAGQPVLMEAPTNQSELDKAAAAVEVYDGPDVFLHPRPQEIGGIEYTPPEVTEELPPEIDPKDPEGSIRAMAAAMGWRVKG